MNKGLYFAGLIGVLASVSSALAAAKIASDLAPLPKRQATVDTAERLAQRKGPTRLPADLPSPFSPSDFDKADASDPLNVAGGLRPGSAPVSPTPAGGPAAPVAPPTARETLETLAAQITPSGMILRAGTPRLIIGNKPFEVGTRFTATYNNQDYDLELVAIDRTTFTLRYLREEITRPIKPVR